MIINPELFWVNTNMRTEMLQFIDFSLENSLYLLSQEKKYCWHIKITLKLEQRWGKIFDAQASITKGAFCM